MSTGKNKRQQDAVISSQAEVDVERRRVGNERHNMRSLELGDDEQQPRYDNTRFLPGLDRQASTFWLILLLGVIAIVGCGGFIYERFFVVNSMPEEGPTFVSSSIQGATDRVSMEDFGSLTQEQAPPVSGPMSQVSIHGREAHIEWQSNMGQKFKKTDWTYEVRIKSETGEYHVVQCDQIHYIGNQQEKLQCIINVEKLKTEPLNLKMGYHVQVQILGISRGESYLLDPVKSETAIQAYISGAIQLGNLDDEQYPLDVEYGLFPTEEVLASIDPDEDIRLNKIRLNVRSTKQGYSRLHGIQLEFTNGLKSPFFKGIETGQSETILALNVNPDKKIAGAQIKQKNEYLTGLRLIDDKGGFISDYSWQLGPETGDWQPIQRIPAGKQIIGITVHEPQEDIYRLAFNLWDK